MKRWRRLTLNRKEARSKRRQQQETTMKKMRIRFQDFLVSVTMNLRSAPSLPAPSRFTFNSSTSSGSWHYSWLSSTMVNLKRGSIERARALTLVRSFHSIQEDQRWIRRREGHQAEERKEGEEWLSYWASEIYCFSMHVCLSFLEDEWGLDEHNQWT